MKTYVLHPMRQTYAIKKMPRRSSNTQYCATPPLLTRSSPSCAASPLCSGIALVAQDTYLFNDTLRANILIAKPDANDTDLAEALERASLTEFVAGLPDGWDTPVGERGMRLSGGQRQRVAIARAFLKDAPVLILDEATSHLDAINEQTVRAALQDLMSERTTIVIAHRLSTIRDADLIVVLADGRVAETGTHDALLAKRGLYAHLVSRQIAARRNSFSGDARRDRNIVDGYASAGAGYPTN